ncbi:MAG: UDP-N-acetyl-D-mannosamine dehydrogenase [Spirochaetaceae bacterium]|nr:UDP-N-acetyl-D-mannosamine dehydrogenase [Spirochaetaceae bacterium]
MMNNSIKDICVLGLGYIGLPSAALLANRGYRVYGVDVVENVVDTINEGNIHIVEPDLDTFVRSAVQSGALTASVQPHPADVFIIAVPTPFKNDHSPDLTYVEKAALAIVPHVKPGNLVILESTSPVGTTERVNEILVENGVSSGTVHIAHCPERVLPGKIMIELTENDRIVGGISPQATEQVAQFYESFVTGQVLKTDARSAELSKLVENSSRDVQIAFANELSIICDKYRIDVWEVIRLANRHPRVNILKPGPGVGGHCIAVDPWFIIDSAPDESVLIRSARERNLYKTRWVVEKVRNSRLRFEKEKGRAPNVVCMGLSYKADIDDIRESPALEIASTLVEDGLKVTVVEPNLRSHPDFTLISTAEAVHSADIMVFLVQHKEFAGVEVNPRTEVLDFCGVTRQ